MCGSCPPVNIGRQDLIVFLEMQYDHLSIQSILLADDDEDDRMLFEDALNQVKSKVRLSTAEDGHMLLEMLKNRPLPDVIFLDLNMPGKNGFECLQEIRQAQQDVRDEHAMSNLRAEIMEAQEDVRRESESDVSSAHSPTEVHSQATSASRYQVSKS